MLSEHPDHLVRACDIATKSNIDNSIGKRESLSVNRVSLAYSQLGYHYFSSNGFFVYSYKEVECIKL